MDAFKERLRNEIMNRLKWFYLIFMLLIVGICVRLVCIRYGSHDTARTSKVIHSSLISKDTIYAHRGSIYSRNGEALATSIFRHSIFVDFGSEWCDDSLRFVKAADSLSKLLAAYFGERKADDYYKQMVALRNRCRRYEVVGTQEVEYSEGWFCEKFGIKNKTRTEPKLKLRRTHTYTRLFRDIDKNEWEVLKQYPILSKMSTVIDIESDTRVYPYSTLALRTIGRSDKKRPYGIEHAYRDSLAGRHGLRWLQRIAHGFKAEVEDEEHRSVEAIDGADIVTTLDVDLQDFVDKSLRQHLVDDGGIWGTSVVMECATGDILAMANLRRHGNKCYEDWDYAYRTRMEPGSTFKLATAITLLEDAKMSPNKRYHTGLKRVVKIGDKHKTEVIDDHEIGKKTKGMVDMRTAFAESSNVYFTKAAYETYKDDPARFINSLKRLHLDRRVGLEELNERQSHLPSPDQKKIWHGSSLVNIAYGYAVEVTPMQTLTLYNAVANNGRMVAPRLISRIERGGEIVKEFPTRVLVDSICSQRTLATLRGFLEEAAETGTGKTYFGEGKNPFRVGLKTGTAKVALDTIKYRDGYYLASMVTYLPAENPKYTFITAIFKHKSKGKTAGGAVAGPMQFQIAQYLHNRDQKESFNPLAEASTFAHSDLKGGYIPHIRIAANQRNINLVGESNGWGQIETNELTTIVKALGNEHLTVPNVMGMGLSDAIFLLESRGLKVRFKGAGRVVKQSIEAGQRIEPPTTIEIMLSEQTEPKNPTPTKKRK